MCNKTRVTSDKLTFRSVDGVFCTYNIQGGYLKREDGKEPYNSDFNDLIKYLEKRRLPVPRWLYE